MQLISLIKKNDTDYKKDVYLKLEKYLGYVQNIAIEYIPREKEILALIKYNLGLFDFKIIFKEELDEKGYISNDSIL